MRCLFLVRTPFHAFLVKRIIQSEEPEVADVWHVCKPWSPKAENYARELASISRRVVFEPRVSGREWRDLFKAAPFRARDYDRIYCASLHPFYFRALVGSAAELRTYDDGAGNYSNGLRALETGKDKYYALARGLATLAQLEGRSVAHYAVRPDLPNSFPANKITPIDLGIQMGGGKTPLTIAIGQPFGDYLPPETEARMREQLGELPYFPHPRESSPPAGAIQTAEILEDYVARKSLDFDITLVGGFSTAMLTIPQVKKIYLDADGNAKRREIMIAAGCEVRDLSQ